MAGRALILWVFLSFFVAAAGTEAYCRDFPMQHFTVDNGLPSNIVYSVFRDHNDYMWFATDMGVVRYNGISFDKFTTADGLPDNETFFFQEDLEHRIWIACYNGELCFYKDGVFHTASNTPYLKLPKHYAFATSMEIEKDSSITIVFSDGSGFVNIRNGKSRVLSEKDLDANPVQGPLPLQVEKVNEHTYIVMWQACKVLIDTNGKSLDSTRYKNAGSYRVSRTHGQLYLCRNEQVYSLSEQPLWSITNKELQKTFIHRLARFDNTWFFGTLSGLFVNNDIKILQGSNVSEVATDVEGNYWVVTLNNGIFRLSRDFLSTGSYGNAYHGDMRYAREVRGQLYFTTTTGNLYRLDNDGPELVFDESKQQSRVMRSKEVGVNTVVSFGKLLDTNLRYYSFENSISFEADVAGSKRGRVVNWTSPRWIGGIKELVEDGDLVYIRASFGVNAMKKSDLNANLFDTLIDQKNFYKRVYGIAVGPDRKLWFSGLDRMYYVAGGHMDSAAQFGTLAYRSMCIAGKYMVGVSQKNELAVCYDYDGKAVVSRHTEERCIWDKVYRLTDSTFLVSTDSHYRLLSTSPSSGKPAFRVQVIENESLPVQAEYICIGDAAVYFFKDGSIVKSPKNDLFISHPGPRVLFKSLKTRNMIFTDRSGIVISYSESKNINISFTSFSFGSKYVVCECSVSKDSAHYWRTMNGNEINLFDPGYGDYIVKVRAKTLSGEFGPPYVFTFTVAKPWWATWWFFTACGFAITAIVALIVRRHQRNVAREKSYLQKELSALRLQMNPHFLFNTLNSIYSLSKMSSSRTPDMVLKLSDMLRYVTYKSTEALTTVEEEIGIIDAYVDLQMARFEGRVEITKKMDVDEPHSSVVPLLLLPLIENAFKHGIGAREDKSFIDISLGLHKHILTLKMENSIAAESVRPGDYEGLGLANIRRQLSLLYKKYSLTTSATGNIFVLQLMINLNSYAGDKLSDNRR